MILGIDLAFKFDEHREFNEAVTTILEAYQRYDTMAEINFNIRKLQLLAT
jgi:hypothetical protein